MSERATSIDFEAARARLAESRERAALCSIPIGPFSEPPATPAVSVPRRHPSHATSVDEVRANMASAHERPRGLKGSRLPLDVQAWIRTELANGASLNALANALGVTRDRIRVVRDGESVRRSRYYAQHRGKVNA